MNILILGCGQIGAALAQQLNQQGHGVTTVSRQPKDLGAVAHLVQDLATLDLAQQPLFDWVYVIISPDARNAVAYQQTFMDTAQPVFRALAGHPVQKVVFVSSTRVYGEDDGSWIDDDTIADSQDDIGQCLLQAEQRWRSYWQDKLIVIRPSGLYQEDSRYLRYLAHFSQEITSLHWTNRIHRQDVVGFLAYLTTLAATQSHYILSDDAPLLRHVLINQLRALQGKPAITVGDNLPITGKRCSARNLRQSGYPLRYPSVTDLICEGQVVLQ